MHISSIRIRNYRSFGDSGALSFFPGINLVVGANNVGKSALLACLAVRFVGDPQKSLNTLPTADAPFATGSRVDYTTVVNGEEIRKTLLQQGNAARYFPWPNDTQHDPQHASSVWQRIVAAESIPLNAYASATINNNPTWVADPAPVFRLYETRLDANSMPALTVNVDATTNTFALTSGVSIARDQDFGFTMIQLMAQRIYKFDAERFSVGASAYGASPGLLPDARNLPEVLSVLQGNPSRFQEYSSLVSEIFPTIRAVSVKPTTLNSSHPLEVLVWQIDPALQRDDLATSLNRSGTGVGQVLAMLYVVKTSDQPRTIIIDEPGSFLHPGAARALIGILRKFPQHQYIIATHSPEIIAELADAPVTIVRWDGAESIIEQHPRATSAVVAAELAEVGARLSDVYGYDNVLWVEGPSDASGLKIVLELTGRLHRRTAIMPVRDTGAFSKRTMAEVLEIYRKLSSGDALLPPALAFLFDRDGRSAKEITDMERAGKGAVRFLTRRMFENYLLNVKAITDLYNEAAKGAGLPAKVESDVDHWIKVNGQKFHNAATPDAVFSKEWNLEANAAALLQNLFIGLSEAKLEYRKAVHTPRLAELTYEHDRAAVEQIVNLVADILG
jgi:uncharacterized protein with GYD domain